MTGHMLTSGQTPNASTYARILLNQQDIRITPVRLAPTRRGFFLLVGSGVGFIFGLYNRRKPTLYIRIEKKRRSDQVQLQDPPGSSAPGVFTICINIAYNTYMPGNNAWLFYGE